MCERRLQRQRLPEVKPAAAAPAAARRACGSAATSAVRPVPPPPAGNFAPALPEAAPAITPTAQLVAPLPSQDQANSCSGSACPDVNSELIVDNNTSDGAGSPVGQVLGGVAVLGALALGASLLMSGASGAPLAGMAVSPAPVSGVSASSTALEPEPPPEPPTDRTAPFDYGGNPD